jgi:hypothetical protein
MVAVEAADEAEARTIVDMLLDKMFITPIGAPEFRQFDDGTWVAEIHVDTPKFEQDEVDDAMSILSTLKANLGPVTWRSLARPLDNLNLDATATIEWPPGYWVLLGRRETLAHPSVRAMKLQAHRTD